MSKPYIKKDPIISAGKNVLALSNGETEVCFTVKGGHMAPVKFFADSEKPVEPYFISPWQEEDGPVEGPGVLEPLRGDFFCMPFGGNNKYKDEVHPPHGEVSEQDWEFSDGSASDKGESFIELKIQTKVRAGTVTKRASIRRGHSAIYISHKIEDFAGPVTLGHHAILPGDRVHFLSTLPLITGITDTAPPPPSSGEYFSADPGKFFELLSDVPTIWKDPSRADYSVFPMLNGFVDILQVFPENPGPGKPMWFTASVPSHGYLWYSFKSPDILPSTLIWQENRGRHEAPWNGRTSCMGIEEVLGHLASGLEVSIEENILTKRGLRTSMVLDGKNPLIIKNIQGVCRIPDGFDRVATISFRPGKVIFHSVAGPAAEADVDWDFVLE
jgi:hypothetical protein